MLYIFLGYATPQLYFSLGMLKTDPLSVLFFSLAVFLIWSFIPTLGYFFAKLLGAKGQSHKAMLFVYGFVAGIIEKALYHFNVISFNGDMLGTIIVACILFLCAFLSIMPPKNAEQNQ